MTAEAAAGLSAAEKRALLQRLLDQQQSFPVTAGQRRLWILHELAPAGAAYHFPVALRITGAYDVEVLRGAMQALVDRHASFRTVFTEEQGELTQRVIHGARASFDVVDVDDVDDVDDASPVDDDALRARVLEAAQAPFDLAAGPLFRVTLFRRASDAVLLLLWHHIVLDGWSLALVLEELGIIHAALATGETPQLPPALPYRAFATWQRAMLAGPEGARHAAFWQEALGSAERLVLPTDHPRSAMRGYRGKPVHFTLGESITRDVASLATELATTPFVVLLAAFQALLHRMTGSASVPVTFPTNGRTDSRFARTAGYFVNQVAVNARIGGETTFRELVAATRASVLGALEHQDYPLALLPVPPQGDEIQQRVADVMFILQKSQGFDLKVSRGTLRESGLIDRGVTRRGTLGGLTVEVFHLDDTTSRFDLELHLMEMGGALVAWMQYDADLFEQRTIEAFTTRYQRFLEHAVHAVDERVAHVDLLSAEERRRIVVDWNATDRAYPTLRDIADMFEDVARRAPDGVAATCGSESITFGSLDRQANRIARWLDQRGAVPGEIVGLCVPRSLPMLPALLGILKAGCVYLPLDPASPDERLALMLRDSGARMTLTSRSTRDRIAAQGALSLCMDCNRETIDALDDSPPPRVPCELAYIVYTSGSTGAPKGVMGTQRGLVNRLHWGWEQFPAGTHEVCAQLTTLSFVDATTEIFGALLRGVPLAIVPDEHVRDAALLVRTLEERRATSVTLVPSLLRVLLGTPDAAQRLRDVGLWFCSGEALDATLASRFHDTFPRARLVNLYGCSEASGDSCWYEVERDRNDERVPIGRPIANTRVYVLDDYGNPTAAGVTGEIHIAGAGVAAGYFERPALTAERFAANPFVDGDRMYRTGDLGRFRADEVIDYLGRADRQLKIRGNRVEAGEVEALLRDHPRVANAAVSSTREESGDHALVAHVEPREAATVGAESPMLAAALRTYLAERLPGYMVPSHVILLDRLPLTVSGKVDWRALPATSPAATPDYAAPRTTVERRLVEIWERVLNVSPISVDADFFDLGGHSILALQAAAQATTAFGRAVPVALIFQHSTISSLATQLEDDGTNESRHRLITIESRGTRPPLFWVPGGVGALGFVKLKQLAAILGRDQPFYGFATQWASTLAEVESVPDRAREYLKLIREAQPSGPYHLVGFCLGGVIAYEMARQLDAEGERVALLALVNTWMPADAVKPSHWLAFFAQRAIYYAGVSVRQRRIPVHRFLMDRARNFRRILRGERFAEVAQLISNAEGNDSARDEDLPEQTTWLATIHLASKYRPAPFAGRVHVMVSAETEVRGVGPRFDPRRAWRRVSAVCEITEVGGGHMPRIEDLGQALRRALADAGSPHGGSLP